MLPAILTLLVLPQDPTATAAVTPPAPQVFHLSGDRSVTGTVLKETDDAVFVDLGHDVIRLPLASIVQGSTLNASVSGHTSPARPGRNS